MKVNKIINLIRYLVMLVFVKEVSYVNKVWIIGNIFLVYCL